MLPRLVAIDLDGTLLPRSKEVTPRTLRAIRALSAAGTEVVLATGKSLHLAERYAAELSLDGPVIALDGGLVRNGGSVRDGGSVSDGSSRILTRVALERDAAAKAVGLLANLDVHPFLVDGADRLLIHEALAEQESWLAVYADRRTISAAPLDEAEGDPFFLSFRGPPDAVRRGMELLRPLAALPSEGGGLSLFDVHFLTYDASLIVLRPETSKGVALALVAEHLSIPQEAVAAVGDWRNDTEMLRWAGLGVAMPGSIAETIDAADIVLPTGCEDDGVAEWIEAILSGSHGAGSHGAGSHEEIQDGA